MGDKTLKEVCNSFHVSRRAIQGYEKAKLVAPSGKNERGYLLYDEKAQERIQQIRMYQQLGFSLQTIGLLMDASNEEKREALEYQVEKLRKEIKEKQLLIQKVQELINAL